MAADVRDFLKDQKDLYFPKTEPVIVDVPSMKFLMVDGHGAPDPDAGTAPHISDFQRAIGALYGLVYSVKMSYKKDTQPEGYYNFKVPPLEAQWWMADGKKFDMSRPNDWRWTAMIRVPEYVTEAVVAGYADELARKKKTDSYKQVRLETFTEGPSVQIMHIGSYAEEAPNIAKMHTYAQEQGYKLHGKHHELYYGDPRRTAPEKLKTVLRQPVTK